MGAIVVSALAVAGVAAVTQPTPAPSHASAAEVQAYANSIARLATPAGRVVDTDMKPSVAAWENGSLDAATFADRARGWAIAMRRTGAAIARVRTPAGLDGAQSGFIAALQNYAHAADLFAAAAAQPAGTASATAAARSGDRAYDSASGYLQDALREAGLAPDIRFPGATR